MSNIIDDLLSYKAYNSNGDILIDYSGVGSSNNIQPTRIVDVTPDNKDTLKSLLETESNITIKCRPGTYVFNDVITINKANVHLLCDEGTVFENTNFIIKGQTWGSGLSSNIPLQNVYHNVGSKVIYTDICPFNVGNDIRIVRNGNDAFIDYIGMSKIPERPDGLPVLQWSPFKLEYSRKIRNITKNNGHYEIEIDESLPCSIDPKWGGGYVYKYTNKRINNIKISGVTLKSNDKNATCFFIDNCENVLIENTTCINCDRFVTCGRKSKNCTIDKCKYIEPSSELLGGNRHAFHIQGELILVKDCFADKARHPISVDSQVCGPNVAYKCYSSNDICACEPHHRWSVGGLFDNVSSTIYIQNRSWYGSGHGWSGANYICWNCDGSIKCQTPPTAINFAIGCKGYRKLGDFPNNQDGLWLNFGSNVYPTSLYEFQRKNKDIKTTQV
jgi:hypothetical protein